MGRRLIKGQSRVIVCKLVVSTLFVERFGFQLLLPMLVPVLGPCVRHNSHLCTTMSDRPGYHHRQPILAAHICRLLYSLGSSTYDETAPKIDHWVECVIAEQFTTTGGLVGRVPSMTWGYRGSRSNLSWFSKESSLRCTPPLRAPEIHRLRGVYFGGFQQPQRTASPSIVMPPPVVSGGSDGFVRAGLFIGHLVGRGLPSYDLVRKHLIKPLVTSPRPLSKPPQLTVRYHPAFWRWRSKPLIRRRGLHQVITTGASCAGGAGEITSLRGYC
jgi:hypothetical protein